MTTHPIDRLFKIISARIGGDPAQSYTAKLLSEGEVHCAQKMGEEAIETVIAAIGQDKDALTAESADLLYHLLVLWTARGVTPEEVYSALAAREGQSGITEKSSRKD
jgi:phosphoribosyl-ATP pyrophosphohydrolase